MSDALIWFCAKGTFTNSFADEVYC